MATQYADNAKKRSVNVPSEKIEVCEQGGRVRMAYDSITPSVAVPQGDKVVFGKLPKGARIILMKIVSNVGSGVANIGWSASPDGAEAESANGLAVGQDLTSPTIITTLDKKLAGDVDIVATITNVAGLTADGTCSIAVLYTLD